VEVADRSLPSDRLTKSRIYASGAVDEYWIVNLRDRCIEVYRRAIPKERRFADVGIVRAGERPMLVAIPGVAIAVDELLPPPATSR
jgi:Uma2 family endonuclease